MNYIQTEIDGVWLIEPKVFSDSRGYFMESFKKEEFEKHIGKVNFIQDPNHHSVYYEDYIIRQVNIAKQNWYASLKVKY